MASATDKVRNAAPGFSTTTTGSITSSSTTVGLSSVTGLPTGTGITITIDAVNASGQPTPGVKETMNGVVSSSNVVNLVRGLSGTTAQSHASGAIVEMLVTANLWNDFQAAFLEDHEQTHGYHQGLHDTNGAQWIAQTATASAVNYLNVANAATGNGVVLSAVGSDTNIPITISPKGTGSVIIPNKGFSYPYKFFAYRSSSWTDGSGAFGLVTFDTAVFDTGSNYSTSTGKFTAPATGFYEFSATVSSIVNANNVSMVSLYKNGSELIRGNEILNGANNFAAARSVSVPVISLTSGDYIQVYSYGTGGAGNVGNAPYVTYFSGSFKSAT